jgi:peptidoglycan/LPS O-acetylase OafA/YrhL
MRFHPPGHADVSSSVWPGFCFNLRRSTVKVNTRLILIVFALLLLPLLVAARPMQADPPDLTAEQLAVIAGIVLSLLFSYIPGVRAKYEPQPPEVKRLIMLALLAVVALGVFGLSCTGYYSWATCDQQGAIKLGEIFFAALVANQAAYLISPKPTASHG